MTTSSSIGEKTVSGTMAEAFEEDAVSVVVWPENDPTKAVPVVGLVNEIN